MFKSATFRLTVWYISIVMAICLIFSAAIYRVSTAELKRSLDHQSLRILTLIPGVSDDSRFKSSTDYDYSSKRILRNLIVVNLLMLVGAGLASYGLARRTLEPIERAHERQKRFTADVSHELRTPLTAIRMESEVALLDKKITANELKKALKSNVEETVKLEGLINNLLRLTKLEVSELQQDFEQISTAKFVDAAVRQMQKTAKAKSIKINLRVKDSKITGDQDSLVQAVVILLDNAIKYSPKGTSVLIKGKTKDDNYLLSVKDRGVGIEPEALNYIFDRFYRADNSRTKAGDPDGFGLGLSIAKIIAEKHSGDIKIDSTKDVGTTATLILPTSHY